jgi:hypothetical protein
LAAGSALEAPSTRTASLFFTQTSRVFANFVL